MKKYFLIILLVLVLIFIFLPKTHSYKQYELKAWGKTITDRGQVGRSCFKGAGNKKVDYPKDYIYKGYSECLKNAKLEFISTDEIKSSGIYRGVTDYGISCEFTLGIYYNGWDEWCEVAWFYTNENIPVGSATSLRVP